MRRHKHFLLFPPSFPCQLSKSGNSSVVCDRRVNHGTLQGSLLGQLSRCNSPHLFILVNLEPSIFLFGRLSNIFTKQYFVGFPRCLLFLAQYLVAVP